MLSIREYSPQDAEIILSWITDEKTFRQWSADKYENYPAMPEDVNDFYDSIRPNGAIPLIFCHDGKAVGHFILRPLSDGSVNTVRIGFIIVDNSLRGKGYGKKMLEAALKYALDKFKCERITLGVFENNPKAQRCYESVGFRQYGEDKFFINEEDWKCLEMEYKIKSCATLV